MGMDDPNRDPVWREKIADVLRSWESVGIIGPAWSVEYDRREGCFVSTFTLFATWGPHPRKYQFNEVEMSGYVTALADWFPDEAGTAAVALAEEVREEAP